MKTKGRVERDITAFNQKGLTIYRPGFLANRRNDERLGEKIADCIPFITKIESRDMGAAMIEGAVNQINNPTDRAVVLSNQQIKDMLAASRPKI